jgi:hypothetical protein
MRFGVRRGRSRRERVAEIDLAEPTTAPWPNHGQIGEASGAVADGG